MSFRDPMNPLMQAIREDDLQKLKELISAGANVHTSKAEEEYWRDDSLRIRFEKGEEREIVVNGVSVNYSLCNESPLHAACSVGSTQMVRELLKAGACVNARGVRGCTPLNRAVQSPRKNLEIIKVLLEYGADINAVFRRIIPCKEAAYSPLDYAILGELPVAKLLVKIYLIKTCNFRKNINLERYWCKFLSNYSKIIKYFDDCVSEIVEMKTEMMNKQISLFDIVSKETIDLSSDSEWVKKMKDTMIEKYPVYHDIIDEKIEICIRRRSLLNELRELFCFKEVERHEEKQILVLHPNTLVVIASHLSTEDLSNFVGALST